MPKLQDAIKYSVEGPLHKAIEYLEEILRSNPWEKIAASYLADVYCRLGKYERAYILLSKMREKGAWDEELESQWKRVNRIWQDLKKVEKSRFRGEMFLSRAIVPDGKGGYLVDTLGFPGTWDVQIDLPRYLPPGAYLRVLKSLAWATGEIRKGNIRSAKCLPFQMVMFTGTVKVEEKKEESISISFLERKGEGYKWLVSVGWEFLFWEREVQRREIREIIEGGSFRIRQETERTIHSMSPETDPRLVLVSLGLASDYAVTILRDRLLDQGIPAAASFVRSLKYIEDYLDTYSSMPELKNRPPHIFAISVLDATIREACLVIAMLRQRFPQAFVIVGGPTSQTPEQFAALVPDFDILIRGDGDEVLSQVVRTIGKTKRTDGLSDAQIERLKGFPGGLIIQQKNRRIVHRIDYTNIPKRYHLPRPDRKKTIYYWQTSRGCPYDCRFCYKWSGKRYHMVVPWEDDLEGVSMAKRSALAMKEFLLSRLALEWPEGISKTRLEELLKESKVSGRPISRLDLNEKIFIVIEDDDFLINRERIREFYRIVDQLGLQRYFVFTAITSVRTLYRGGDVVDREILEWLKACNFKSIDIGSDGLCRSTISENQKGYTLDRHVIPLNMLLKEMGFFAFNNTIVTTPYTTIPQFIESLIFYILCPYPINIAIEIGIMGHIGTKYTNEDIVNQQYDWQGEDGEDYGHFKIKDNYFVPVGFPEYALNSSHMISYADPKVRELVLKFPHQEPIRFFKDNDIEAEEVENVVKSWIEASDVQPEISALGRSLQLLQRRNNNRDFTHAILTIKEEMSMLGLSSFVQYYGRLKEDKIKNDPQYKWIIGQRLKTARHKEMRRWEDVERGLKLLVEKAPWYFRPHQELIILLINRGKVSAAVEHFSLYQVIDPNILFYFDFFNHLIKALHIEDTIRKDRVLFHIPRYYTISPIYYFLALLKEMGGGEKVKDFSFSRCSPQDVENLYDLFDYLTIDIIKGVISNCSLDISEELRKGREINFMGVPVRLENGGRRLALDYRRIRTDAALSIE
nr:hypothetical protein [Desulfobacterales bacterium]